MKDCQKTIVRLLGLLMALLMPVFSGCHNHGNNYSRELVAIDSLAQVNPDSAWQRICDYDTALLRTANDRHYFALLSAEASDKTYNGVPDGNALGEAAEYFMKRNDRRKVMRSMFYKGLAYQEAGRYGSAIITLLKSIEMADTAEHLYRGKIYNAISETYKAAGDVPQELEYARHSLEEYQKLDSLVFIEDMKVACGYALCCNKILDAGIRQIREVYDSAKARDDEEMVRYALMYMSLGYLWNSEDKKANDCLALLYSGHRESPLHGDYIEMYLNTMISLSSPADSIAEVAESLLKSDTLRELPYNYYAYRHDYKSAYEQLLKESRQNDTVLITRLRSSTGLEVSGYLDERRKESDQRNSYLSNLVLWLLVCLVLLIALLAAIWRIYAINKRKREKEFLYSMELLVKEKSEMTGLVEKLHMEADILSKDNENLLRDNNELKNVEAERLMHESYLIEKIFKDIDELHSDYYIFGSTDKVRGKLLSRLSKQIKFLREDEALLAAMEGHVNNFHSNLLHDLYEYVKLTPDQRRIVAFRGLRLSKEVICQIMGLSIDNYHSRVYRLGKRISACDSSRKDELFDLLHEDKA